MAPTLVIWRISQHTQHFGLFWTVALLYLSNRGYRYNFNIGLVYAFLQLSRIPEALVDVIVIQAKMHGTIEIDGCNFAYAYLKAKVSE